MSLSIFRSVLIFLLLLSIHPAFAQTPSWLSQYSQHTRYGDVYVVKKVSVPCRSYETFLTDLNGKKLTPAYRDIAGFSEGLAEFVPMELDAKGLGKHGFINKKGEVVIPAEYVGTDKFMEGKTWVIYRAGKQYGLSYIDLTGKTIYRVPIEHFYKDFLIADAEVKAVCNQDCREDVLWWKDGNLFILNWNFSRFNEKEIRGAKGGIYHFLYQGKYGVIDKNMILRIPLALDGIDPKYKFSGQGLERVQYGEKFAYMNRHTGILVTAFDYTDTRRPTAGLFWCKKDGKWGCIDINGKQKIPHLYDEATGFTKEDRSAVAINGKFGHIDKKGRIRTPLQYDFASYYQNGRSMVRVGDKYGYIDTTAKYVIEPVYDEALPFDNETAMVEKNWMRYELSLDGSTSFAGFSYKLNAVFIILGALVFIWLNNLLYQRFGHLLIRRKKA